MHINYKKHLLKNKFALAGLLMTGILFIVAVFAPWLAPCDPWSHQGEPLAGISKHHLLGLNDIGQDIFSELVYSARTSLSLGLCVSLGTTMIAVLMGLTAAVNKGIWRRMVLRLIDAFLVIPEFLLVLILASYVKPGMLTLIFFLAISLWPQGARLTYIQSTVLLKSLHLLAAKSFGAGKLYILSRHVLPELFPIVVVLIIQYLRLSIFLEANLAFIGAIDSGVKSWGMMFQYAGNFLYGDIWLRWLLPTGLAVTWAITGFSLLGHALEEIIDPRLRSKFKDHVGDKQVKGQF